MTRTPASSDTWVLHLFIAGSTPKSVRALENLKRICREHLAGACRIEVVDLIDEPERAQREQVVAIPTLIRQLPPPVRKIIGDLSDTQRVLVGLDIVPSPREGG